MRLYCFMTVQGPRGAWDRAFDEALDGPLDRSEQMQRGQQTHDDRSQTETEEGRQKTEPERRCHSHSGPAGRALGGSSGRRTEAGGVLPNGGGEGGATGRRASGGRGQRRQLRMFLSRSPGTLRVSPEHQQRSNAVQDSQWVAGSAG